MCKQIFSTIYVLQQVTIYLTCFFFNFVKKYINTRIIEIILIQEVLNENKYIITQFLTKEERCGIIICTQVAKIM